MRLSIFLLAAAVGCSQTPPQQPTPPAPSAQPTQQPNQEQQDLQRAVNEAGASTIDLTRVLEEFLKKYPQATQLKEIERALSKAAIDNKDDRRTVLYGERVLVSTPDDMLVLDRVARAELTIGGKENAEK